MWDSHKENRDAHVWHSHKQNWFLLKKTKGISLARKLNNPFIIHALSQFTWNFFWENPGLDSAEGAEGMKIFDFDNPRSL